MQALASLGSTDISRKDIQQETSRSQLQGDNETVITDLPINFDISLAPTDLRQKQMKPSAPLNGRISQNMSISIMSEALN